MSALRRLFAKLASLVGVPEVQRRLDAAEQALRESAAQRAALERLMNKQVTELVEDTERVLTSQMNSLVDQVSTSIDQVSTSLSVQLTHLRVLLDEAQAVLTTNMLSHVEEVSNEVRTEFRSVLETLASDLVRHRRLVDNLNQTWSRNPALTAPETSSNYSSPTMKVDEAMYVALEDHFRGAQEEIRARQMQYLPVMSRAPISDHYVLDLGCGRGEWLEVLKEAGVEARGVDSNLACVSECQGKNLQVIHADLVEHLRSLPDGECSVITMFQVLEHLPFPVLLDVLREIRRVLCINGLLIAEVPNSENLSVGASTFWIDPTHERPLFPGLLKFLATEIGFAKVDGMYSSPIRETPALDGLERTVSECIMAVHKAIYGPADFALIAQV